MKKIKIGIIGCGAVAYRWYLPGLSKKGSKHKLFAVCDIDYNKAKKAAKDFHVKYFFNDVDSLVNSKIDLAVILTRHDSHYDLIKYFFDKNINVYSEKPFALTNKKCQELIKLANKKKLTFGCAPQVMLSSRNQKVKKILEQKVIGKISYIRASCSNLGPAGRKDTNYNPKWFYNESGSIWSLGIYGLSTLIWWFGKPKFLASMSEVSFPERKILFGPNKGEIFKVSSYDNTIAILNFGNGTLASFDGSYSIANPPKNDFEIHGEYGSIFVGGFGGKESIILQLTNKKPRAIGPDDNCHLNWTLAWGVIETAKAIVDKREPLTSSKLATDVISVIEKMMISSKTKNFIKV